MAGYRYPFVALVAGTASVAACDGGTGIDCATVDPVPFSINVRVEFPSGTPEPHPEPSGLVTGNGYSEFMTRVGVRDLISIAPLGTYDVSVTADGFEPWTTRGVRTRRGVCGGFKPVGLTATLTPDS